MIPSIMKNTRYTVVARLGALIALAAILAPAVMAQEPAAKPQQSFKLNAQVIQAAPQSPQLSREEGDQLLSHLVPAAGKDQEGIASQTGQGKPVSTLPGFSNPAYHQQPLQANVRADQKVPQAQQGPQAYLTEYGVDWSGWISQMAARWHYNLRRLEAQSNVSFVTQRPALIQFTCAANGQVGNFSLKQSSGIYAYDQLQMLALSQVTPLPPFPKGTRCATITLVQGWESHAKQPGEIGFDPRAFGRRFPMEKVQQWVRSN